jgi:hypothetical protein
MDRFIKVQKNGEVISIHPDTLKEHQSLGWVIVDEKIAAAVVAAEEVKETTKVETGKGKK